MNYTEKDIKFLRSAKSYADEFVTCVAKRQIGSIIVKNGRAVSDGVNGPPSGVEHIENRFVKHGNKAVAGIGWFYSLIVGEWVKIVDNNKFIDTDYNVKLLVNKGSIPIPDAYEDAEGIYSIRDFVLADKDKCENINKQRVIEFKDEFDKKGEVIEVSDEITCPRYLFGFKSGEQLDICGCVHSEENSIICCALNGISCKDTTLYCYCGIPCIRCTGKIINSGIKKVVCLDDGLPDYSPASRIYFKEAGVEIVQIPIDLV